MPSPFDTVLSPEQVLSAASLFISGGCDPVAALGLTRMSPAYFLVVSLAFLLLEFLDCRRYRNKGTDDTG